MLEEDDITGAGVPSDEQVPLSGEFNRDVTWHIAGGAQDQHARYLLSRFDECQSIPDGEQVALGPHAKPCRA